MVSKWRKLLNIMPKPYILFLLLLPLLASGQSRLELLNADISRGVTSDGVFYRILEGNVHARQDTIELFCDKATYIESLRKVILENNVKIIKGRDTLTASRVTYFEEIKMGIAEDTVHVWRAGQDLFTNYLEYSYQTDYAKARKGVKLRDEENRVTITALEGEYLPELKQSYVQKKAHLIQLDSTGLDTLHIFARRMEYFSDENPRATAIDSVKIIKENLIATCDSAIYAINENRVFMELNPHAKQENSEMTGAQMEMVLKENEIEQILVRGRANVNSLIDSTSGKHNELAGKEIIMYISSRKLEELWAISNASSKYYFIEKNENKGLNTATADTIRAFFSKGQLDSIDVKGGSQGIFYPSDYKGKIEDNF
jgi:lipopolysaccharide export system protein LptA